MSVRHHEQLFSYQQREFQLTQSLRECSHALEEALTLLKSPYSSRDNTIPPHLLETSVKFSVMTSMSQDGTMSQYLDNNPPSGRM